ncbi:hypothetical protein T4E_5689, partial [Trichinella pseudospiralis]
MVNFGGSQRLQQSQPLSNVSSAVSSIEEAVGFLQSAGTLGTSTATG